MAKIIITFNEEHLSTTTLLKRDLSLNVIFLMNEKNTCGQCGELFLQYKLQLRHLKLHSALMKCSKLDRLPESIIQQDTSMTTNHYCIS